MPTSPDGQPGESSHPPRAEAEAPAARHFSTALLSQLGDTWRPAPQGSGQSHNSAELPDIAEKKYQHCADWYRRNLGPGEEPDCSRRDISEIHRLLRDGYSDGQIYHGMWPIIQEECGLKSRQKKHPSYLGIR